MREGSRVVIIGGGPGGYEAALTAIQLGARCTLIEDKGVGGSAVLTDVVPSKTLIASAEWLYSVESADQLGIVATGEPWRASFSAINARIRDLAARQSNDIRARLLTVGVTVLDGRGAIASTLGRDGTRVVRAELADGTVRDLEAEVVLIATGATPRELPDAKPDGERILNWTQMYGLTELPRHLVVVGSGVTGAEFAGAYNALGVPVTLVSSRDRVLPNEDPDGAAVIERVFGRRGMTILSRSRAQTVRRSEDGVVVTLDDGREVEASHCLLAVGSIPNSSGIGLELAGVALEDSGHIKVDRVSRTTAFRVYAAGDITGSLPLASVAAMQGRTAMNHALGDYVEPLDLTGVAANIFTAPEIASVGVSQREVDEGLDALVTIIPLARNPRAKMQGMTEGFVKLFADASTRVILGGVVVAPSASEHILPIALAVSQRMTADEVASVFTVYPSLSGSITEAARQLRGSIGADHIRNVMARTSVTLDQ
ncbi:NAD(P)H-quinone dehydrogenase [Flaviflexus salsibiostraticola]|uniref:NAD(P)H dehydrogenase (quinone) n=1 Tax=Flaviflexus salsibiostraticola TaxID=1282737 RepID=A0A3S8ZC37_9ACTO|nr:NAD(P)H-quinone dehydrogenase [Flaviflexus salsibiostraticola]